MTTLCKRSGKAIASSCWRSNSASGKLLLELFLLLLPTLALRAQFTTTITDGSVTIVDYTGEGGDVIIPDAIDGLPVTGIGPYAFTSCRSLTGLTIPDSVTDLGPSAFSWCTSLTNVTIGNGLTRIGYSAFSSCTRLSGLMIGNSVSRIEDYAFLHCSALTTVTIPDGVSIIGAHAFNGCTSLSRIVTGNGVTSIGEGAFQYDTGLTSITIPGSVTGIGGNAFYGCLRLAAIYFEGDAPAVGKDAFSNTPAMLYFVAGTKGWGEILDGRPTVAWHGVFGAHTFQLCGGVTIIGEIGNVFMVEYATDLPETAESNWRCLEFLQLPTSPYLWVDKSAPATAIRFYRAAAMEPPTNIVFIPPGTFRMGSPTDEVDRMDDEGPRMTIISRGFWMGKYEVTQRDYQAVMGYFPGDLGTDMSLPVGSIRWDDATNYCATLTEQERLAGRIATNAVYRLPTEAEWEYACRAWTSTRFSHGDDPGYANLTGYAWCEDNSDLRTHPVGQKLPNPWGLYDMHGNVLEWCQDWYDEYGHGIALDPQGPAAGRFRLLRGGSSIYDVGFCRSAARFREYSDHGWSNMGFRVVLVPGEL